MVNITYKIPAFSEIIINKQITFLMVLSTDEKKRVIWETGNILDTGDRTCTSEEVNCEEKE